MSDRSSCRLNFRSLAGKRMRNKERVLVTSSQSPFCNGGLFWGDSCGPFRFFLDSLSPAFFLLLAAFLALHCFFAFHAFSRAVCIAFPCFSTAFLYFPASCLLVAYSSAFHGLYCRCFVFVASQALSLSCFSGFLLFSYSCFFALLSFLRPFVDPVVFCTSFALLRVFDREGRRCPCEGLCVFVLWRDTNVCGTEGVEMALVACCY